MHKFYILDMITQSEFEFIEAIGDSSQNGENGYESNGYTKLNRIERYFITCGLAYIRLDFKNAYTVYTKLVEKGFDLTSFILLIARKMELEGKDWAYLKNRFGIE